MKVADIFNRYSYNDGIIAKRNIGALHEKIELHYES